MKKYLLKSLALAGCLCLSTGLIACGSDAGNQSGNETEIGAEETTETTENSGDEESAQAAESDSTAEDESSEGSTEITLDFSLTDNGDGSVSADLFAMDTYMSITAYGEKAAEAVAAAGLEIERLDVLLTTGSDSSAVGEINENGSGILPEEGIYLLTRGLQLWDETDGDFDPAIYPMMELWGFPMEEYRVPTDEEIEAAMKLIDASKIEFDEESGTVSFAVSGMALDFGGIAKGYTSSRVADIFKEYGVEHGLVNLGGNVQTIGTKTDGSNWRVAIQDPDDTYGMLGVLETHDTAVITSGGYERYFEQDGKRYHHIIDPSTGRPAESGLLSSTIVSGDGTLADGLSTSLFIMGKDEAAQFWREHSEEFDYILCDEDKHLYVTEGIADSFSSDYEVTVVTKD